MVDKPVNYNSSAQSIRVDPDQLWRLGHTTLPDRSHEVGTTLSSIAQTWSELKLSWQGDSAEEAKRFNDDWIKLINKLFGPEDPKADVRPGEAILPKIADAAAQAAFHFGSAEDAVIKVFQPFIDAKPGPPGSSRDDRTGPITEINAPKHPGA